MKPLRSERQADRPADPIYSTPAHPYTRLLLDAVPVPDPTFRVEVSDASQPEAPSALTAYEGCPFLARCPRVVEACASVDPALVATPTGQQVACHNPLVPTDAPGQPE